MKSDFKEKFKKALEFVENSKIESPNKPAIPHVKRVGFYLYKKGFSDDVVNAGLLHDTLEWSDTSEHNIKDGFGSYVLELIKANTKDRNIEDKQARRQSQIEKCLEIGDDALAIKVADNIDSFLYYSEIQDKSKELKRCTDWNDLLTIHMSEGLRKKFEKEIKNIYPKGVSVP